MFEEMCLSEVDLMGMAEMLRSSSRGEFLKQAWKSLGLCGRDIHSWLNSLDLSVDAPDSHGSRSRTLTCLTSRL